MDFKLNTENLFHVIMTALGSFALFYASQLISTMDDLSKAVTKLAITTEVIDSVVARHDVDIEALKKGTKDNWTRMEQIEYKEYMDERVKRIWEEINKARAVQ